MNIQAWRYKRFHVSYLLGWFSFGLLAGLFMGRNSSGSLDSAMLIMTALILTLGALRSRRWWAVVVIVAAGMLLGLLRGSTVQEGYAAYDSLLNHHVTLQGKMTGDAQRGAGNRQQITITDVKSERVQYPGEAFVILYSDAQLKRGDIISIEGAAREGFASYGAVLSGAKLVKLERGEDMIRDIRERFTGALRAVVIEPMASLGLGFVVGQRSTLPDTLDEQLKVVGLTHIVVASGYNLTILVRFMMRLLSKHSRYLALIGSLLMITSFVLFSGFSPSMNRAVIVTTLGLLAWYVGRRFHPVLLIAYVASMTAFVNPMYVWSDLGWYLSFFAFAGILVVAPLVVGLLYKRRQPVAIEQLVIETMSAEMMALPLVAFAFGTLPVFALVANILVAPLIPAAMLFTAISGTIAMISTSVAAVAALPTTLLIGYMVAVVEWLAGLPHAQYDIEFDVVMIGLWYGAMAVACVIIQHKTSYSFRRRDHRLEV